MPDIKFKNDATWH